MSLNMCLIKHLLDYKARCNQATCQAVLGLSFRGLRRFLGSLRRPGFGFARARDLIWAGRSSERWSVYQALCSQTYC